ncbi:MAG: DUF2062 domain-containing protein [bacterium]|nr:DUF2062 domain-containing protein [bacterium]
MAWLKSIWHRFTSWLVGHKDPKEVALGLALGAAISLTPLIGLHAVLAVLLASITPSNRLAAILGTQLGNPFTLPFFFWLEYKIGSWITGVQVTTSLSFSQIGLEGAARRMVQLFGEAAWPYSVGMVVLAVLVGLAVYGLTVLTARVLHLRMRRRLVDTGSDEKSPPPS